MSLPRAALFIFFFMSITEVYGQKMPIDYFDEGLDAIEHENDSSALSAFYYIVNNHPKNELFPRAYFNLGYIYHKTHNYANAVGIFKNILHGGFNDLEPSGSPGLMSEPYTNYKHQAAYFLCKIYQGLGAYDTALFFLFQSDTVYPYRHFCGNEQMANTIANAVAYANIYEHLNQVSRAEQVLLAVSFYSGLASNQEALDSLKTLFKKHEDPKQLRRELEKSITNYKVDTDYYEMDTAFSYSIFFLGQKIDSHYGIFDEHYNFNFDGASNKISKRKKVIAYLRKSELFKIVKEL